MYICLFLFIPRWLGTEKINTREGIVRYKFESSFLDKNEKKNSFFVLIFIFVSLQKIRILFIYVT